jgi:rubredoxin
MLKNSIMSDPTESPENLEPTTGKKSIASDEDRFECRACGYDYDPNKGDPKNKIIAGTPFSALPSDWKCPVCTAKKGVFINIGMNAVSGFKENQGYGFGVNTMTESQKSLLIYGGLGLGILLFLSLYSLN